MKNYQEKIKKIFTVLNQNIKWEVGGQTCCFDNRVKRKGLICIWFLSVAQGQGCDTFV